MKPFVKVTFDFGDEIKEVKFTNKENIEELIDTLTAAYAELEHRIEMKRIKNKERKERRKQKGSFSEQTSYSKALDALEKEAVALDNLKVRDFCKNCELQIDKMQAVPDSSLNKLIEDFTKEYECIEKLYNNLPDCKFKSDLKPYLELAKMLLECMKK